MIRPIFLEPETLLDRCVFSQNQHTFIPAQLRIRRDVHIEFSVFFQRKNVDVILFRILISPIVRSIHSGGMVTSMMAWSSCSSI